MRVALATLALAAALTAASAGATASGTGLFGTVVKGPITPMCVAELPCTAPAVGAVLSFTRGDLVVARVTVAKDGSYRVRLAPGLYGVRTSVRHVDPTSVLVRAGVLKRADFSIDTGIR
jgi:hypothetical protein